MKKAFIITILVLIGAVFVGGFVLIIGMLDGIAGDTPPIDYSQNNNLVEYKLSPNEEISLSPEMFDDYVSINEISYSGKGFAEFNEKWYDFDDGTYCLYNKYYVNNNACAEEKIVYDDTYRYYYFGRDLQNPELIFEISNFTSHQWLIKKEYKFPKVGVDTVKNVLFIPMKHSVYMNLSSSKIQRLNQTTAIYVNDYTLEEKLINDYLAKKFDYDYISSYGIVDTTERHMILVEFEDSVVYQCIGEI